MSEPTRPDKSGRPATMALEVLYFEGCPSHDRLLPVLHELAAKHDVAIEQLRIETAEQAEQSRFLGSPTVRVNGIDVEPGAEKRRDFGLKCRIYRSSEGQSGLPPREWIERVLYEADR